MSGLTSSRWCVFALFFGCVATPPAPPPVGPRPTVVPVHWSADLKAARRTAGDRLIVVHFTTVVSSQLATRQRESDGNVRDAFAEDLVRQLLAEFVPVRLFAGDQHKLFRAAFDAAPEQAICVMDRDGVVVATHAGSISATGVHRFLVRARQGYPAVVAAETAREALSHRAPRLAQMRATFLSAEAYLTSGNPIAAHRYFTLVTLLNPGTANAVVRARAACEHLARLEVDRGNNRDAREWLENIRIDGALSDRVRLTEAMIAMVERRMTDAHAILAELHPDENNPEADRVLLEYGRVCHATRRDAEARGAFSALLARYPDSPFMELARAELGQLDDRAGRKQ